MELERGAAVPMEPSCRAIGSIARTTLALTMRRSEAHSGFGLTFGGPWRRFGFHHRAERRQKIGMTDSDWLLSWVCFRLHSVVDAARFSILGNVGL